MYGILRRVPYDRTPCFMSTASVLSSVLLSRTTHAPSHLIVVYWFTNLHDHSCTYTCGVRRKGVNGFTTSHKVEIQASIDMMIKMKGRTGLPCYGDASRRLRLCMGHPSSCVGLPTSPTSASRFRAMARSCGVRPSASTPSGSVAPFSTRIESPA